jgi:hypothetical protein
MAYPFQPVTLNPDQVITAAQVNHLPIIAHYARRLGLVEIVNRLVPVEMEVEPGLIVLGLVLDTLSGRSPLYHLESAYHRLKLRVIEQPRYAPGRPKHHGPRPPIAMEFRLYAEVIEKQHELDRRRQMAGCFVLLTNVPSEGGQGYSAEEILRTYKDQHAIERNFGFLKDDQIVNALFLKRPERIEALGLELLISLLIWRLIEHVMRTDLAARNATLPGWDNKPTCRPTAYMMTWKFKGIIVLCVGQQRHLAQPLSLVQKAFLRVLQVPEHYFTHPPRAG